MIETARASEQPIRLNQRTWRGVLAWIGLGVAGVGVLEFVGARWLIAQGFDWVDPVTLIPIPVFIAIGLAVFGTVTEWTVAEHELRRRSWLSGPGRKPASVMQLGPHLEILHETRTGWRIQPYGTAIYVARGQGPLLISAMERSGVRVNDWRGAWERRHPMLDRLGSLITLVGVVGQLLILAQGPWSTIGFASFWLFWSAIMLGFGIDFLPWRMRKQSTQREA